MPEPTLLSFLHSLPKRFVVKGVKMTSRLEINDYLDNIQPKRFDAWSILVNEHSSRDRVCLA